MSNDVVKKDPISLDNFAGWEDGVEGDDRPEGAGIIQGSLVKFTNEAMWVTRDGDELSADLELVAIDVGRVVQKWSDGQPVETIILEPHQLFPDIEAMNEKVPKKEWVEGPDGNMRGPWQAQHILYLLDLKTMDRFTFPTGTTGGRIAVRELRDKLIWMRRVKRDQNIYPVILLADVFMNTRFGGRQRPHFMIKRWIRFGGEGSQVEALPPPPSPPAQQTTSPPDLPLNEVKEPSLAEEMDDEIPTFAEASPKPVNLIYLGHHINGAHNGPWVISKDGKELHRADSEDAAKAWVRASTIDKKPAKTGAKKPPPKRRSNILAAG
jgi:hypothetical protein